MDVMTIEQRHNNMQNIRSRDTQAEIMLRKALWHRGVRYRKNWKQLPGTPDIVLTRQHIAIFVDGDFWHAHNHRENPGEQVGTNQEFWREKLERNVEHDKLVNDTLTSMGWLVLRFWESDIRKNLDEVVAQIVSYII